MKIGAPSTTSFRESDKKSVNDNGTKDQKIYWCITDHRFFGCTTQHVISTDPGATYEQLLSKTRQSVGHQNVNMLKYSREDSKKATNNVVINDTESMNLAIQFMGDKALDLKEGIMAYTA